MADAMFPQPVAALGNWIEQELQARGSAFGIPRDIFFAPDDGRRLTSRFVGNRLDTPVGVAAGPHTQMAQNIAAAYLVGARFLELKTVQVLDELEVTKPCIDMEDVGYNCEWSQELKLEQSFGEYLSAWLLLHGLRQRLGFAGTAEDPGFVLNMSVGYDLKGIESARVQRFLDAMTRATDRDLQQRRAAELAGQPGWSGLQLRGLPETISTSVTLSTMHGCPPDEIERIARYLIEDLGLHTAVKLNPTLLGPELLRQILHDELGFVDAQVPDEAFAHDPSYDDAVAMIRSLAEVAANKGVFFGLKLTNTLETRNVRKVLPEGEAMHYLSGRALHPLGVAIAHRLSEELAGQVPMSFAGGADAFNVDRLIACNLTPVTVCSDCLKPGGYGRLSQSLRRLQQAVEEQRAASPEEYVWRFALGCRGGESERQRRRDRVAVLLTEQVRQHSAVPWSEGQGAELCSALANGGSSLADAFDAVGGEQSDTDRLTIEEQLVRAGARVNLADYAAQVREAPRYRKRRRPASTKSSRVLGPFDCVQAPCEEGCPSHQGISQYMALTEHGRLDEAMAVVLQSNPLPSITGCACDHPCMGRCVRTHYDQPLAIREIKRFISERAARRPSTVASKEVRAEGGKDGAVRVAVVGAGPAGLAAAHYLALAGLQVTVFDARAEAGGVPAAMIPAYRLPSAALAEDIAAVERLGVEIRFGVRVGRDVSLEQLRQDYRYVFLGIGAGEGVKLGVPGEGAEGVHDCLELLARVRAGQAPVLGERALVIGGGNSAMDAARTARRLVGTGGKTTLVYRRAIQQMPAEDEEIDALQEEGIDIVELMAPEEVVTDEPGRVRGLRCTPMVLGPLDSSGRPRPVPSGAPDVTLPADSIVVAVGQGSAVEALNASGVAVDGRGNVAVDATTGETSVEGVFAGGDGVRGGASIIQAVADARRAVAEMLRREKLSETSSVEGKEDGPSTPRGSRDANASPESAQDFRTDALARRSVRVLAEPLPQLPVADRHGFAQVNQSLSEEQARREAARCLHCDEFCGLCVTVCPNRANHWYASEPFEMALEELQVRDGQVHRTVGAGRTFRVEQPTQIVNLADWCNECGNCQTFCPTAGAPYQDKPRLCLTAESFAAEKTAYQLTRTGDGWRLQYKEAPASHRGQQSESRLHTVELSSDGILYVSPKIRARLRTDLSVESVSVGDEAADGDRCDLAQCATMVTLARGLAADARFWHPASS